MLDKVWRIVVIMIILMLILIILLVLLEHNIDAEYSGKYEKVSIMINNQEVVLEKNSVRNELDLSTLNSEFDTIVNTSNLNRANIKVNNIKLKRNKDVNLGKISISKENKIQIDVKFKGSKEYKTYYINTLNSKFPKYNSTGKSEYEGDYYMTTYYNQSKGYFIFKLNRNGELIYYKDTIKIAFDFDKTIVNGKIRYSYLVADFTYKKLEDVGYIPTKFIIMDEKYNVIDEVLYKEKEGNLLPCENHSSMFIDDGHYILSTYEGKEVINIPESLETNNGKSKVASSRLQEIKNGEIIWEWNSTQYPELYSHSTWLNDFTNKTIRNADYVHFNSMVIDKKDDNLICCFRNLDEIIKINRKTGEIMWIFGRKR